MSIRILANHAHVFPDTLNPDGSISRLLRLLDACGIEQVVGFAPFPHQMPGPVSNQNQWLAKEVARQPRLLGFGTVDLKRDDVAQQVAQIRELGLVGIKMHPNAQEFDILEPAAMKAYEAAQKHGLFITFHSGIHHYRLAHYNVKKFDEVAYHFPDLRFSLEHVGGYAFFNEAIGVISNNIPFPPIPGRQCRVYGGLTSIFTPDYNRLWYMPPERMRELFAQVGADQLIFGLDFPYNLEPQTLKGLQALRELGLTQVELEKVLGQNLRAALAIR